MNLVIVTGSPTTHSRSAWLAQLAAVQLGDRARQVDTIAVRSLPAEALLTADATHAKIRAALAQIAHADVVIIATPIYKAAYSGLLKAFLDLLPQDGLRGKTVLPLATGGTPAHLLALDYALRPVLTALGARDVLDSVFAVDAQLAPHAVGGYVPEPALSTRLRRALEPLLGQSVAATADARCSA